MDAYTRIHALLEEGRISEAEARLLLEALEGEPEAARRELCWARIQVRAGNLEITQDPALDQPRVEGAATIQAVPDGIRVTDRAKAREGGGLLRWIGALKDRRVHLYLPLGWGVVLEEVTGNVEADRLPYLKGSLRTGNLEVDELGGLELSVRTGNVELELCLSEGQHRLELGTGNAELTLLPGSSVTLEGAVGVGRVEASGAFEAQGKGMGRSVAGRVGEGKAVFKAHVRMGNLELEVCDER
ncbi:hypothetical protein [Marinithermus hydrothermalis]|uniref:Adhesin domain-containing protein n=1 Tax=Marinithermus hydrothermalis (strain DSM 14884 / JCM 11576 / T1) TaxID=869210 RepID=F2NMN2_MARHT|nr:hypothetical protein [Marinithermus hydrothermalis]AEB12416.1 hypothetical protein Marky_1681 [Marinithermus hydrothermalis DSM 14884]